MTLVLGAIDVAMVEERGKHVLVFAVVPSVVVPSVVAPSVVVLSAAVLSVVVL